MGAGQSSEKKSPTKGFYQVTSSPEKTSSPEESPETSPSKSNEAKIKAGGDSLVTPAEPVVVVEVSEEEVASLLEMITCKPPVTSAGVKFASLGLSVLIACNSLIGSPENEKVTIKKFKIRLSQM